jgi:mRNA interferase HicA
MKSSEFKRWLTKQGVTFSSKGKGSHQRVYLNGRVSIFADHPAKEIPTGTLEKIKKDLGLK